MGSDLEEQLRAARLMIERFDTSLRVKEGENALLRAEVETLRRGLAVAQTECLELYARLRVEAVAGARASVAWLESERRRLKDERAG